MLRMLIVDDEKIIRETIRDIIDWDALGIEVAGVCKNGLEAYDMILDEYPDIVLTDINMPGLSGLDLIRRITQGAQSAEFVILSGYGDYTYTREAMKLGIQYYLLKPCNEEEIVEVMQQVIQQCLQRRLRQDQQKENCQMLKHLHESVAHNLLAESLSVQPDFKGLEHKYEQFLSFTNVGYEVCRIESTARSISAACVQAFLEYHNAHAESIPYYCLHVGDASYIGFESYDYDYSSLDECMAQACAPACSYRRISVRCLNDLLPQIHALMQAHGNHVYVGVERKWLCRTETGSSDILPSESCTDFVARIIELVTENISDPALSLKYISENCLYMNVDYVSRKFLKTTGEKFSVFLAKVRISKAKSIMAADRKIGINIVADAVGCGNNPQYFSQLFKKMEGVTPTDYLKSLEA